MLKTLKISALTLALLTTVQGKATGSSSKKRNYIVSEGIAADFEPTTKDVDSSLVESLKEFRPALHAAEKEPHIEIENPIIGVLQLPIHSELEDRLQWSPASYIEATHVKFLEAAGARIMPIPLDLSFRELRSLMGKLNGLYIPGDSSELLHDEKY